MTQASLPFAGASATPLAWADAGGTGFGIGRDHARYRLTPPVEHLQPGNPVRRGWEAGKSAFASRTLRADRCHREWLRLRLNAWLRGRAFESFQVTPAFLRAIDVPHCSVTREPLTRGIGAAASDATIDRVNVNAGYAAGNLAMTSARANAAKAALGWHEVLAVARRIESERLGDIEGLDAAAWSRLGVLMSLTTPLAHDSAAGLPLLVLPPPRLRVLNAVQALQAMLTLQFARDGYGRRIAALVELMPCADTRHAARLVLHTLLARRIAAGRLDDPLALRRTLEDAWSDAPLLQRWQRLAQRIDEPGCERIVRLAVRRGLAGPGLRWLPRELATDGWALATRGHVEPADAGVERTQLQRARGMPVPAAAPERRVAAMPAPCTSG